MERGDDSESESWSREGERRWMRGAESETVVMTMRRPSGSGRMRHGLPATMTAFSRSHEVDQRWTRVKLGESFSRVIRLLPSQSMSAGRMPMSRMELRSEERRREPLPRMRREPS
jgi:hypothetical protein